MKGTPKPRMNKTRLLELSFIKFGDSFNYDKVPEDVGTRSIVIITCKKHGDFTLSIRDHLRSKNGCPQCFRKDVEEVRRCFYSNPDNAELTLPFLEQELDVKTRGKTITVRCPYHGDSLKLHQSVVRGVSCMDCHNIRQRMDVEHFKLKFDEMYADSGFVVDYSTYIRSGEKIKVTCPKHGVFYKKPCKLLHDGDKSKGCPRCSVSENTFATIKRVSRDKDVYLNKESGIYLLKLKSEDIDCYKLGVAKDLKHRVSQIRSSSGANIEVLFYEKLDKYNAIIEEQTLLQNRGDLQYHSPTSFAGCNELLTLSDEQASDLIEYLDGMVRRVKQT